jgi:hypothetical protein
MVTLLERTDHPGDGRQVADLPRPLAFVLSGGASSGATQVGMLRALRAAGVRPETGPHPPPSVPGRCPAGADPTQPSR